MTFNVSQHIYYVIDINISSTRISKTLHWTPITFITNVYAKLAEIITKNFGDR